MRVSIIIASHNEGELLGKTLGACIAATSDLCLTGYEWEFVVADDASSDGSVQRAKERFPFLHIVGHSERRGCSASKDLGARASSGDVLVFIDGHCKPERFGILRLVDDVVELHGEAIVTPRVPSLDVERWNNQMYYSGFGAQLSLDTLETKWLELDQMEQRGRLRESPGLIGCCLALSQRLYEKLRGFDRHMLQWGVEDSDFGLKSWMMGNPVLNDPAAIIGHRFRASFDNFSVAMESVIANQMRLARKNFTDEVWNDWCARARGRNGESLWERALALYERGKESAEEERAYLFASRPHDEFWYAKRFGLQWPIRPGATTAAAGGC